MRTSWFTCKWSTWISFPKFSIVLVWLVRSNPVFQKVWDKADGPVAAGKVARLWLWGPQANYLGMETYVEGENGERLVRYYDKSRMEVNHPGSNSSDPYYVSNGLLVTELIANEIQLGDSEFITATVPSTLPVAGDPRKDNPLTPGYQALGECRACTGRTRRLTGLDSALTRPSM